MLSQELHWLVAVVGNGMQGHVILKYTYKQTENDQY